MSQTVWEDMVSLGARTSGTFDVLGPASEHVAADGHGTDWSSLEPLLSAALKLDTLPLPKSADREGYYGPHHFSYWASGLRDMSLLNDCLRRLEISPKTYLDFGCASGRVIRHLSANQENAEVLGCDINRKHVDWCNKYLPSNLTVFQNHSIPSLPLPDQSVDVITAYSVFTHIEAFETSWLMEFQRILRPGGIAWITFHSEHTLTDLKESWPIYDALKNHPEFQQIAKSREMSSDRMVFRWHNDKSYSSNVFYRTEYIKAVWGRFFEIAEIHRRHPVFQDVVVLQKL